MYTGRGAEFGPVSSAGSPMLEYIYIYMYPYTAIDIYTHPEARSLAPHAPTSDSLASNDPYLKVESIDLKVISKCVT